MFIYHDVSITVFIVLISMTYVFHSWNIALSCKHTIRPAYLRPTSLIVADTLWPNLVVYYAGRFCWAPSYGHAIHHVQFHCCQGETILLSIHTTVQLTQLICALSTGPCPCIVSLPGILIIGSCPLHDRQAALCSMRRLPFAWWAPALCMTAAALFMMGKLPCTG